MIFMEKPLSSFSASYHDAGKTARHDVHCGTVGELDFCYLHFKGSLLA
jgi:hypothetical protein